MCKYKMEGVCKIYPSYEECPVDCPNYSTEKGTSTYFVSVSFPKGNANVYYTGSLETEGEIRECEAAIKEADPDFKDAVIMFIRRLEEKT